LDGRGSKRKLCTAHKKVLHETAPGTSIKLQVHDGPPGACTRRLSSFLLIPVG